MAGVHFATFIVTSLPFSGTLYMRMTCLNNQILLLKNQT